MATAAAFLTNVGAAWDAEVYGALSDASRLAAAVKDRANSVRIAFGLRKVNAQLNDLFRNIQRDVDAAETGKASNKAGSDETITSQRLHEAAADVDHLARMLDSLHENARRARLTNNSLMAGSLRGIFKHIDQLHDLADWFETAAQMDEVNAIFARAKEEKERGETYDLSQVS